MRKPSPDSVWQDRDFVRPLMICADLGRAVLLLLVPLGVLLDLLSLPLLGAIAVAAGALTVLFDVSYLSVLPGLVRREQIQQANGGLEASRAAAAVAGRGSAARSSRCYERPAR